MKRVALFLIVTLLALSAAACAAPASERAPGVSAAQNAPDATGASGIASTATVSVAITTPTIDVPSTATAMQATVDAAVASTMSAPAAQPTTTTAEPSPIAATATATPTTTSSPTSTITPTATPCHWTLEPDLNAYIRQGPAEAYDIIGSLRAGDVVAIVARDASSSWWLIDFGGRMGWVADSVVSVNECPEDLPVVTPPPTPTPTMTPTPLPTATPAFNPPPVIAEVELVREDHIPYSQPGRCDRASRYTVSALVSDATGVAEVTLLWVIQDRIYERYPQVGEDPYRPSGDPIYDGAAMELLADFDPLGQSLIGRYTQTFLVPFPLEYPIDDPVNNETDYLSRWVFWYIVAEDSAGKSWSYEGEPQQMFSCAWQ